MRNKFSLVNPDGVIMNWDSITECAKDLGVSTGNIGDLLAGRRKSVKGWKHRKVRGRVGDTNIVSIPTNLITRTFDFKTFTGSDLESAKSCLLRLIIKTSYTSKRALGCLTEMVSSTNTGSYDEFKMEYMSKNAHIYQIAKQQFIDEMRKFELDKKTYTDAFLSEYFEAATLYESYVSIQNQNISCQVVADFINESWSIASSKEDSAGIDAYIGNHPVQVKTINSKDKFRYDAYRLIQYDLKKNLVKFTKSYLIDGVVEA